MQDASAGMGMSTQESMSSQMYCAGPEGFWDAAQTLREVQQANYFKREDSANIKLPCALQASLLSVRPCSIVLDTLQPVTLA